MGVSLRESAASAVRNQAIIHKALSMWRSFTVRRRAIKALGLRTNIKMLSHCMATWAAFLSRRKRKVDAHRSADSQHRHRRVLCGFIAWRLWLSQVREVSRLPASPELERRAAWGRALALKKQGFAAWRRYMTGKRLPKVALIAKTNP